MTGRVMLADREAFDTPPKRADFWRRMNTAIASLPGITAVSTGSSVPLGGGNTSTEISVPGAAGRPASSHRPTGASSCPATSRRWGSRCAGASSPRRTASARRRCSSSARRSREPTGLGRTPSASPSRRAASAIARTPSSVSRVTSAASASIATCGRRSTTRAWRRPGQPDVYRLAQRRQPGVTRAGDP